MAEPVTAARQAVRTFEWDRAIEGFLAADRDGALTADDLVLLSDAHWWTGRPEDAEKDLERAYAAFLAEGRKTQAALAAGRLAYTATRRLNLAVGSGWVARAEHLLDGELEGPAHACSRCTDSPSSLRSKGTWRKHWRPPTASSTWPCAPTHWTRPRSPSA